MGTYTPACCFGSLRQKKKGTADKPFPDNINRYKWVKTNIFPRIPAFVP